MINIKDFLISPDKSIRQAIATIDANAKGIALVVDNQTHLIATITDGDIRRAIISGTDLDASLASLIGGKKSQPITALVGTSEANLLHLMTENSIRQIPLLDTKNKVVDIALLSDLVKDYELPLSAVVMAGGFGTRLRPLTNNIPKPMLPLGDKPILERTVQQLRRAGIQRLNITTHYLGEKITEHFGDGKDFGVDIEYVKEEQPLGTAGSLSLLKPPQEPLLVMNGDIVTKLDFRALLDYHQEHEADMTVGVKQEEFQIPYGEVEIDGVLITGITEKPIKRYFINAGIYLLNPDVCQLIPSNERYDMPSLIQELISQGRRVASFPIHEYWVDIGKHPDYQKAMNDVEQENETNLS